MNRDEISRVFKSGSGHDITNALKAYYKEKFSQGKIIPLEFYHPGDLQKENKIRQNSEADISSLADEVFSI